VLHKPNRLRQRSSREDGFSLIELLVVVLIIGILAAIAIPIFISQSAKASDSAAKTQLGTMRTAMQAYASENNGSFAGVTLAKLQKIEPTLKDTSTAVAGEVVNPTATGFTLESEAVGSKHVYKLVDTQGALAHECSAAGKGGCSAGGTW
jgi:type IV pilus assembly protein PilA